MPTGRLRYRTVTRAIFAPSSTRSMASKLSLHCNGTAGNLPDDRVVVVEPRLIGQIEEDLPVSGVAAPRGQPERTARVTRETQLVAPIPAVARILAGPGTSALDDEERHHSMEREVVVVARLRQSGEARHRHRRVVDQQAGANQPAVGQMKRRGFRRADQFEFAGLEWRTLGRRGQRPRALDQAKHVCRKRRDVGIEIRKIRTNVVARHEQRRGARGVERREILEARHEHDAWIPRRVFALFREPVERLENCRNDDGRLLVALERQPALPNELVVGAFECFQREVADCGASHPRQAS